MNALEAPGGWPAAGARMAALVGTYLVLMVVLLVGRIPVVERTLGQDRLTRWHRHLAPWTLVSICAHVVLVIVASADQARTGALQEFADMLRSYPWILAATSGFFLLVAAAVTSARIARRHMHYETWWAVHLYTYLALALSFPHTLLGASFAGQPFARAFWIVLWLLTAGTVLVYRVLLPLWRTVRHRLRVVAVEPIAPGVVSVICQGRFLERLPLSGGQFMQWRILKPGLWWQAHPYSVSALPAPPHLRFTVKAAGDHSGGLAELTPGTRLAIEGPYGAFTADSRSRDHVALIGAGLGITPLRALLEDMPAEVDVAMVVRASQANELILRDELRLLLARRASTLHELIGPRSSAALGPATLAPLIPDIAHRDVFICGPTGFTASVRESLRTLGVPAKRVHHETFAF